MASTGIDLHEFDPSLTLNNSRQERFANEFLEDLNQTKAALRAGYAENGSHVAGHRLVRNDKVWARIEYLQEVRAKVIGIDKHWVLSNLMKVHERSMEAVAVMEFNPVTKEMEQKTKMIEDVDGNSHIVGVYMYDSGGANRSLELIGKHLGMFNLKVDISAKIQTINFAVPPSPFMNALDDKSRNARNESIKLQKIKKKGRQIKQMN